MKERALDNREAVLAFHLEAEARDPDPHFKGLCLGVLETKDALLAQDVAHRLVGFRVSVDEDIGHSLFWFGASCGFGVLLLNDIIFAGHCAGLCSVLPGGSSLLTRLSSPA